MSSPKKEILSSKKETSSSLIFPRVYASNEQLCILKGETSSPEQEIASLKEEIASSKEDKENYSIS